MRRLLTLLSTSIAVIAIGIAAFNYLVVAPAIDKASAMLSSASPSERNLPEPIRQILLSSLGARTKFLVARDILAAQPSQTANMKSARRQCEEWGVGLMLPTYLSENDILGLLASNAPMGQGVRGFSQAATRYLNTPLEKVNLAQAAKLVAISYAPSLYLSNPEQLEQKIHAILSKQSSGGAN